MKKLSFVLLVLFLIFIGPILVIARGEIDFSADYRTSNRDSANLAPDPKTNKEAVIQVYTARAFNWRGAFAVHSWLAIKAKDSDHYEVYQVLGWNAYRGLPVVDVRQDIPDRNWFNQTPKVILDIRGEKAEKMILEIEKAAKSYPYQKQYTLWPGPNSNTFIAYIARQVPNLGLALPSNAIGKDYIASNKFFTKAPSASGYQVSLFGLFGILIAKKEGMEINFLGLVYGIKPKPFQILFPGI